MSPPSTHTTCTRYDAGHSVVGGIFAAATTTTSHNLKNTELVAFIMAQDCYWPRSKLIGQEGLCRLQGRCGPHILRVNGLLVATAGLTVSGEDRHDVAASG